MTGARALASQLGKPGLHLAAAAAGLILAALVAQIWNLEPRYAFASIAGLLILAASMTVLDRLPDLMLFVMALNLPFTGIEKTFLLHNETTYVVGGVGVGLLEILVVGLYLFWALRIFVIRDEPLPRPTMLDAWVFAFWLAHLVSVLNAVSSKLVLFEVVRLAKYALAYFYLAHNIRRRHWKWISAAILCAILTQTGIALVQYKTGKLLGVGQTKGAAEKSYDQYTVPGFEDVRRAEGTTFDSHALGLFLAMTQPVALALALTKRIRPAYRFIAAGVCSFGMAGLAVSFARAGWVAFVGSALVVGVCLARGQYRHTWRRSIPVLALALLAGLISLIPVLPQIRKRILDAPRELVTARVETVEMGFEMWKPVAWSGLGANNYMRDLELTFSIFEGDPYFIPAHNMPAMILFELGVFGFLMFLGWSIAILRAGWKAASVDAPVEQALGAALLGSFVALQLEGIFDPIYVTNVTYFLLWFELGCLAALYRRRKHAEA